MMKRYLSLAACAMGLVLLPAPRALHAQGFITNSTNAARNAAAASNAQTAAEQNTSDPQPTSVVITPAPNPPKYVPVAATSAPSAPAKTATPAPAHTVVAQAAPAPKPVVAPKPIAPAKVASASVATVASTAHAVAKVQPPVTPAAPIAPKVSAPVVNTVNNTPSTDSSARTVSVTERGAKGEVSLNREVYSYSSGGRRDPFVSLMTTGDLRPLITDLRLVAVLYDPTGANSVAVLHDVGSQETIQYRVRVGQTMGRMRVAQIEPRQVVFTIEQVGFSRQETLALGDSTTARTQ